jgi:hypothetical protein
MQRALVLGAGGKNSQPHPLPVGISLSIKSNASQAIDREGEPKVKAALQT